MRIGDVSRRRRRDPKRKHYYARYRHWRFARRWGSAVPAPTASFSALDRYLIDLITDPNNLARSVSR
jgi:hypothetical protein